MIEFVVSKPPRCSSPGHAARRRRGGATVYMVMPLFAGEGLSKRMKAVASERERLRQRERDRLNKSEKVSLRQTPKQVVSKVVKISA